MLLVRSLSFLTSGALAAPRTSRQLGSHRRGIYDKFDGEFASRSQTSTGTVRYQW